MNHIDVGDSLAVLAVGRVISKGSSATATTLIIGFDINAVMTVSTVGDTTHRLAWANGFGTPPAGETLRRLRMRTVFEVPTLPIALEVW